MNQGIFGTSLAELIGAAARKKTGVPPEIAAFIALEVAEGLSTKPAVVETTDVMVTDDGQVAVFPKASAAAEAQAARAVGAVLARILMGGTSVVPPALNALVNRATDVQRGYGDLATLRKDLEAVLIPLNRGAARRVLARFVREVLRQPTPVQSARPIPLDPREGATDAVDELLSALEVGAEKTGVMPHPYGAIPTPLPPQRPVPPPSHEPDLPEPPTTVASPPADVRRPTAPQFGSAPTLLQAPPVAPVSTEHIKEVSGSHLLDDEDPGEIGDELATNPRHKAPLVGVSAGQAAMAAALGTDVPSVPLTAAAAAPAEPFVFDGVAAEESAVPDGLQAAAPAKPMGLEGSVSTPFAAIVPPAAPPTAGGPTPPMGMQAAAPAKPMGLEGSVAMSFDEIAGRAGPPPDLVATDGQQIFSLPGLFDEEESSGGAAPPIPVLPDVGPPSLPFAPPPMGPPPAAGPTKGTILAPVAPPPPDMEVAPPELPNRDRRSSIPPMPAIIPDAAMEQPTTEEGKKWLGPLIMATLLLALAFAGIAVWKPELLGLGHREVKTEHVPPPPAVTTGILSVNSTPPGADVFLLVGRAPAEVRPIATGAAYEFLAIQKGTVPKREVLLANALWLDTPTGPGNTTKRIDLQIRLDALAAGSPPAPVPPAILGAQRDPPGDTPRGVVRVITDPPGASVYIRLGVTPTGPMRDVRLSDAMALLVVRPDHELESLQLTRDEFARAAGAPVERNVVLRPLPGASIDGGVSAAPPVLAPPSLPAVVPPPVAPPPVAPPPQVATQRPPPPVPVAERPRPVAERPRPHGERPTRPARPARPTKALPSNPY